MTSSNPYLKQGRLWQLENNLLLPANIQQAVKYYRDKYSEEFTAVVMRPELREKIKADECAGLKLVSDTSVPGYCLFFTSVDNE
jgi:hypothetical protein